MPTTTTTVTTAEASGVTTTETVTVSAPEPTSKLSAADALFAVDDSPVQWPAGDGVACYEEEIVAGECYRFIVRMQFPNANFLPWITGPVIADKEVGALRKKSVDMFGEIGGLVYDKDVARLMKLCDETGMANEAFKAATADQIVNYGCGIPVSMSCMKLSSGKWACYSVIDPNFKVVGAGKSLKDRMAELGIVPGFTLSASMHHGEFLGAFLETYPDVKTVFSSGFTCPETVKGPNMACIKDRPIDYVIPTPNALAGLRSSPVRDDREALKAALNDEIDFSHIIDIHSEEICFIHKKTKTLYTADVWYSYNKLTGGFGINTTWPAYDGLKDPMDSAFSDLSLINRLWSLVFISGSPNGLLASYWWGLACDLQGFCDATGIMEAEEHRKKPVKDYLADAWSSVQKLCELDWEISVACHLPIVRHKQQAVDTVLATWQWLDTVVPQPFPGEYPPQPPKCC